MISVGITGGIGSGKTTVCRFFERLGIPVYYADRSAKALMEEDRDLANAIQKVFGKAAYLPDGTPDRAYLASAVFGDHEKLRQLNALIHPAVRKDAARWISEQSGVPYFLYEAAILFESGHARTFERIITVYAPEELRIRRVTERDGMTREAVQSRMAHQLPEEEKMKNADFIIYNDGEQSLVSQVLKIHRELIDTDKG